MQDCYNITFTCPGEIADKVFICADFLNWQPVAMFDSENSGWFRYCHKLSPGKYHYCYIVNDKIVLDKDKRYSTAVINGTEYSVRMVYPANVKMMGRGHSAGRRMKKGLQKCRQAAEKGYKLACDNLRLLREAVANTKLGLAQIEDLKAQESASAETVERIKKEFLEVYQTFEHLPITLAEELSRLKKNREIFNIVLFGKTMNGKSTLMEILIQGDGTSIGKGAQRTTLDVRAYEWNGIKIVDVPGICASGGEDDSTVAYEAAKNADLVIFLITDDAPGSEEAKFFNQIRAQGKPVIGLMNVKLRYEDETPEDIEDFIYDLNKKMTGEHCSNVEKQFNEFLATDGACPYVHFIPVHLVARFKAISLLAKEKTLKTKLEKISNFSVFEKEIEKMIATSGALYCQKSFTDVIIVPLGNFINDLFGQSNRLWIQEKLLASKHRELLNWKDSHYISWAINNIKKFVDAERNAIIGLIPDFCEKHCESENASGLWKKEIEALRLTEKSNRFIQNVLLKELDERIENWLSELRFEFDFKFDLNFANKPPVNGKRIWGWTGTSLSVGFTIAAFWWNPAGWIAAGIAVVFAIGSLFFSSRQEKLKKLRSEMEKKLNVQADNIGREIDDKLKKIFNEKIIDGKFKNINGNINATREAIKITAAKQFQLATTMNEHLNKLNGEIVQEIIRYNGCKNVCELIANTARIPGKITLLTVENATTFPEKVRKILEQTLKENIVLVQHCPDIKEQVCRILEIDDCSCSIEQYDKQHFVLLKTKEIYVDADRIALAQQIAGMFIKGED